MARSLGEQIRRLRKMRRLTMKELGDALGYSIDYIWKVETGRSRPSGKLIQALADYFGADLLLDIPEDGESRLVVEKAIRELPAEVREWAKTSDLPKWLILSANAAHSGLSPEQVEQAVKLFQAAKEYLSGEKTDNPK